jgi:adenylate cyclase
MGTRLSEGERRLAAIMYTDMVGYTALGQRNESLSLALVEEQRKLIRPILGRHNGREIKTMGDAFLVEFPNALDAVRCAYDIQRATREFNISLPTEKRIHLRVGLHLGDVVESQGDISGDAVNVASRIEPLAEDGGVCLSRQVFDQVKGKFELPQASLGPRNLKNVSEPVEVFKVIMPWNQSEAAGTQAFPPNRVAILPFASFSVDPNDGFFADGMTEEVISTVSGISGLSVISRTSVMGYKGTTKKVKEIGKELEVGSVVEGSFRKAGNRIRVTVQLVDAASDRHIWVQTYDRTLDDIFQVQSDVAKKVAEALSVRILSDEAERIEKKPTANTAAHSLYLRGRFLWNKRGIDDLKMAAECFERATQEDPGFALGYVGQADCAALLRSNWNIDRDANLMKAKTLVEKALSLDRELAEAHTSKGLLLREEYRLREAEEEFRTAIELKPSYATAHQWYFWILRAELRWEEALREIERAAALDPLSPVINQNYGDYYVSRREYAKAIEPYRKALELGKTDVHGPLAVAYGRMRMFEEMQREADAFAQYLEPVVPEVRSLLDGYGAYFKDDKETVRRLLPKIEAQAGEFNISAAEVADFHFYLGEVDKGFEWLEISYARRESALLNIQWDSNMDQARTDPKYLDLLKRLGLD